MKNVGTGGNQRVRPDRPERVSRRPGAGAGGRRGADAIEWVAVNDLTDAKTLAHLLKYDSILGPYPGTVEAREGAIEVDGRELKVFAERDPGALPWGELGVDVVIESTGLFTDRASAAKHLAGGAKKVVISAPASDPDATVVLGVNFDEVYDRDKHDVISNASCTTNCLGPIAKVVNDTVGINHGLMTTIHAYTADQRLQDMPHKDLRRARAAAINLIPASTGRGEGDRAGDPRAAGQAERLRRARARADRVGRRPDGRVRARDERRGGQRRIEGGLRERAAAGHHGLHRGSDRLQRHRGSQFSSIVDSQLTAVIDGTMLKVVAWYDNEWGYSNRLVDLVQRVL